jgi:hypothetical protein
MGRRLLPTLLGPAGLVKAATARMTQVAILFHVFLRIKL